VGCLGLELLPLAFPPLLFLPRAFLQVAFPSLAPFELLPLLVCAKNEVDESVRDACGFCRFLMGTYRRDEHALLICLFRRFLRTFGFKLYVYFGTRIFPRTLDSISHSAFPLV